jgi:hypothetical protein
MLRPLALTDAQLRLVSLAAQPLPHDKRSAFLTRLAAQLPHLTGGQRPSDTDIERAVMVALKGLLHHAPGGVAA